METDRLLTLRDVSRLLGGTSRASIYRLIKARPGFPQPVKLGASTRFRESDVQGFIAGRNASTGGAAK
ncbi:helix-turn-helix transcriptional regulator [Devosia sp.]|uniref:helix-turn-helix transcriptional regulator n=1 Tax=Devosia sp. TaxID=1871048 RepID=UPI003BA97831